MATVQNILDLVETYAIQRSLYEAAAAAVRTHELTEDPAENDRLKLLDDLGATINAIRDGLQQLEASGPVFQPKAPVDEEVVATTANLLYRAVAWREGQMVTATQVFAALHLPKGRWLVKAGLELLAQQGKLQKFNFGPGGVRYGLPDQRIDVATTEEG